MCSKIANKRHISVIVPVYNMFKFLPNLFDCIKNQTFKDFEVIFVDDGSKDNSPQLLDNFKLECQDNKYDFDCAVIHKKNGGLSSARNVGIDNSNSEFLVFIDSDDSISKNYLEGLLAAIDDGENDIGCVDYKYTNKIKKAELTPIRNKRYFRYNNIGGFGDFAFFICKNSSITKFPSPSYTWNKIYKRSLIGDLRFVPFLPAEDAYFNFQYLQKCKSAGYLNQSLYYYLQRDNSLSRQVDKYNLHMQKMIGEYTDILDLAEKENTNYKKVANYLFCCTELFYLVSLFMKVVKKDKSIKHLFANFLNKNYKYLKDKESKFRIYYWPFFSFIYSIYKLFKLV